MDSKFNLVLDLRIYLCGGVAQLGEHLPCKQGVRSSILLISTKKERNPKGFSYIARRTEKVQRARQEGMKIPMLLEN